MTSCLVTLLASSGSAGTGSLKIIDSVTGKLLRVPFITNKVIADIVDVAVSENYLYLLDVEGNLACYDLDNVFTASINLRKYGSFGTALWVNDLGVCVITSNEEVGVSDPALSNIPVIQVFEHGSLTRRTAYLLNHYYFSDVTGNTSCLSSLDYLVPIGQNKVWLPCIANTTNPTFPDTGYGYTQFGVANYDTISFGLSNIWYDLNLTSNDYSIYPTSNQRALVQVIDTDLAAFTYKLVYFTEQNTTVNSLNPQESLTYLRGPYNLLANLPPDFGTIDLGDYSKGNLQPHLTSTSLTLLLPFTEGSSEYYPDDNSAVNGLMKIELDIATSDIISACKFTLRYLDSDTPKFADPYNVTASIVEGTTDWIIADGYGVWRITSIGDIVWATNGVRPVVYGSGERLSFLKNVRLSEYFIKGTVTALQSSSEREVFVHDQRTGSFLGNAAVVNGEYAFACFTTTPKYAVCKSGFTSENWAIRANLEPLALPQTPAAYVYPVGGIPEALLAPNQPPLNWYGNGPIPHN